MAAVEATVEVRAMVLEVAREDMIAGSRKVRPAKGVTQIEALGLGAGTSLGARAQAEAGRNLLPGPGEEVAGPAGIAGPASRSEVGAGGNG